MTEYERFITGTPRNRAEAQRHERTHVTLSKTADGIPPARKSRILVGRGDGGFTAPPAWLEATVHFTNGTAYVQHVERDDENGRVGMDRWAFMRNLRSDVDYIEVQRVARKTKETGRGTYR